MFSSDLWHFDFVRPKQSLKESKRPIFTEKQCRAQVCQANRSQKYTCSSKNTRLCFALSLAWLRIRHLSICRWLLSYCTGFITVVFKDLIHPDEAFCLVYVLKHQFCLKLLAAGVCLTYNLQKSSTHLNFHTALLLLQSINKLWWRTESRRVLELFLFSSTCGVCWIY